MLNWWQLVAKPPLPVTPTPPLRPAGNPWKLKISETVRFIKEGFFLDPIKTRRTGDYKGVSFNRRLR